MESLSKLYAEDCKLMPTGCDTLVGRQAVVDTFSKEFQSGFVKVILQTSEVGGCADDKSCAYEPGHYTFLDKDGKQLDYGKYVVIWKRVDGELKLYVDMFNSNSA
eukprot:gene9016-16658_t